MAEIQTNTESGEMAQKFIELVMMQAQNAAFALGQIPHPETGEAPVNIELARIFIDHLIVLRAKTRGNLTPDEIAILNNTISNLQMVFLEVAQGGGATPVEAAPEEIEEAAAPEEPTASAPAPEPPQAAAPESTPEETKKKFTKSYGS
jgi:hypothetical protein